MVSVQAILTSTVLALAYLACQCVHGHIIGGAVNTFFLRGPGGANFQNVGRVPSLYQSIVTARRRSTRSERLNLSEGAASSAVSTSGQTSAPTSPEPASPEHPFLRSRRDAQCPWPADISARLAALNTALNVSQFTMTDLSEDYNECPASSGSWWPHPTALNLRSICPWTYVNEPTEDNVYPSHVTQARCLCTDCRQASGSSCHALVVSAKLLQKTGCQSGQAVLREIDWPVKVGCFCAKGVDAQAEPDFEDYPA